MTLVVDASFLVSLLTDGGPAGDWAADQIPHERLAAPALALFEAANVLRRFTKFGELSEAEAARAHDALLLLRIDLFPYSALHERVWALRANYAVYDASYIATAELLGAPLATTDRRIARGPAVNCEIRLFDAAPPPA